MLVCALLCSKLHILLRADNMVSCSVLSIICNERVIYMSAARTKRRKRKIQKNGLPEKVERVLELPVGSLSSAARIELMGNKRVFVDGCLVIV